MSFCVERSIYNDVFTAELAESAEKNHIFITFDVGRSMFDVQSVNVFQQISSFRTRCQVRIRPAVSEGKNSKINSS